MKGKNNLLIPDFLENLIIGEFAGNMVTGPDSIDVMVALLSYLLQS